MMYKVCLHKSPRLLQRRLCLIPKSPVLPVQQIEINPDEPRLLALSTQYKREGTERSYLSPSLFCSSIKWGLWKCKNGPAKYWFRCLFYKYLENIKVCLPHTHSSSNFIAWRCLQPQRRQCRLCKAVAKKRKRKGGRRKEERIKHCLRVIFKIQWRKDCLFSK